MAADRWFSTRDAYKRYAKAVSKPVAFDSFRRFINQGKIKFRKKAKFREVSGKSLAKFIQASKKAKKAAKKPKKAAKKKAPTRKNKPKPLKETRKDRVGKKPRRPRRSSKVSSNLSDEVWKTMAVKSVEELRATGKRPEMLRLALEYISGEKAKKVTDQYIALLEKLAGQVPKAMFEQAISR